MIEPEILSVQRAGDGGVAQLVVSWLRRMDGEVRAPLGRRGLDGARASEVSRVVVNKSLLLVGTCRHHHVVLGADGVARTVGHLDRSHHRTDVVVRLVVRTELAVVVDLARLPTYRLEVVVILLASHWTDHSQVVLVSLMVSHGTDGSPHVPGRPTVLLLGRPHSELLGHERVSHHGALLQAVGSSLAQHPLPPSEGKVQRVPGVQRLDGLSQSPARGNVNTETQTNTTPLQSSPVLSLPDIIVCKSQRLNLGQLRLVWEGGKDDSEFLQSLQARKEN